ncbi:MAG: DUF2971 domain-containing protein [Kiritimatiellae bacterium]|nr:DUF2971 domain-containing protein [Kiritimatiellia bacterium]
MGTNASKEQTSAKIEGDSYTDFFRSLTIMKAKAWRPFLKSTFANEELLSVKDVVPEHFIEKLSDLQRRYHHLVREKVASGSMEGLGMDTPIYRTMPCYHFHTMLETGKLYLTNPMTWVDEFDQWEKSPLSGGVFAMPTHEGERPTQVTAEIKDALMDWYAQSWSLTEECEAIWRRYARKGERAVRIKTTPRKLLLAMCIDEELFDLVFLKHVDYLSEVEIESRKVISWPMQAEESLRGLLCMKRKAFAYENEVRLLFFDRQRANSQCRGKALEFPLKGKMDFSSFIESVCLDPDAPKECAEAEGAFMRKFGLSDHVQISALKQPSLGATIVAIDNRC